MLFGPLVTSTVQLLSFIGGIWASDVNSISKYVVKYYQSNIEKESAKQLIDLYGRENHKGHFEMLRSKRDTGVLDYMCFIPSDLSQNETEEIGTLSKIPEQQDELKQKVVDVLYKTFDRKECVYAFMLNELYWTYGFCFDDKVIQFHENMHYLIENGRHKAENPDFVFVLGRFPNGDRSSIEFENQSTGERNLSVSDISLSDEPLDSFIETNRESKEYQLYASQTLTDGELCDLTQNPRKTKVIYKCDMNNRGHVEIIDVQEITTCEYVMIISIPRLCFIEPFVPIVSQDKPRNINCKLVKNATSQDAKPISNIEDFFSDFERPPTSSELFPSVDGYKLPVTDYILMPCGSGFFIGSRNVPISTPNMYHNHRAVLIYNGMYNDDSELLRKVSEMMLRSIGRTILSPHFDNNHQAVLRWEDTFILWFELYNYTGDLIKLVKIAREGSQPPRSFDLQLIDPTTMLDQDGDLVDIPVMEAPNNAWNFEMYQRFNPLLIADPTVLQKVEQGTASTDQTSSPEDYEILASLLGHSDSDELRKKLESKNLRIVNPGAQ